MEKEMLCKSIEIASPCEKVWRILVEEQYNRQWYAQFNPGSFVQTDWKVGGKILIDDGSGYGLVGRVIQNEAPFALKIEYLGFLEDGQEDIASADAINVRGFTEAYELLESNGITTLTIRQETSSEHLKLFKSMWNKALKKIKTLAEDLN